VLTGDSTEEPRLQLIQSLKNQTDYSSIPNLTWLDKDGAVRSNPIQYVPENLNNLTNNYINLFKLAVKNLDTKSMTAIRDW